MIWTRFLVPFESNLSPEDVRVSARLHCVEMIRAGITGFADAGGVHMDQVAEAVMETGMRAALCPSTMDMGNVVCGEMKHSAEDCIRLTEELHSRYQGSRGWPGGYLVRHTAADDLFKRTDRKDCGKGRGVRHGHSYAPV